MSTFGQKYISSEPPKKGFGMGSNDLTHFCMWVYFGKFSFPPLHYFDITKFDGNKTQSPPFFLKSALTIVLSHSIKCVLVRELSVETKNSNDINTLFS